MIIPDHWFPRILHALREVEIDLTKLARHDHNAGVEQVQESLAVLKLTINRAIDDAKPSGLTDGTNS